MITTERTKVEKDAKTKGNQEKYKGEENLTEKNMDTQDIE